MREHGPDDRIPDDDRFGPGRPLDSGSRSLGESAYGGRLDHVTVHTGPQAQSLVGRHGAAAATVGSRIAFAAGRYHPGTVGGDALLAHELAHVVQQDAPTDSSPETVPPPGPAHAEPEADRAAATALLAGGRHRDAIAALAPEAPPPEPPGGAGKPHRGLGRRLQLALCSAEEEYGISSRGAAPTTRTDASAGARGERIGAADLVDKEILGGYHTVVDGDGDQSAELDLVFTGRGNQQWGPDRVEVTGTRLGNTPDRGGPGTESRTVEFDNRGTSSERSLFPSLVHRTDGRSPTRFEVTGGVYQPYATLDIHPPPLTGDRADYRMDYSRAKRYDEPPRTETRTMSFRRNPSDYYQVFAPAQARQAGPVWALDVVMGRFGDTYRFTFRRPDPARPDVQMGISPMSEGIPVGADLVTLQVRGTLQVAVVPSPGPAIAIDLDGDRTADIRVWETMVPRADWHGGSIQDPARHRDIRLVVTSGDGATEYGHSDRQVREGSYTESGTHMPTEFGAVSAAATPEGLVLSAATPDLLSDLAATEQQIRELRGAAGLPPEATRAYDALVAAWVAAAGAPGPIGNPALNVSAAAAATAFADVWERVTRGATVTRSGGVRGASYSGNEFTGYESTSGYRSTSPTARTLTGALATNNRREASRLMGIVAGQVARFAARTLREAGRTGDADRMESLAALHSRLYGLVDKKPTRVAAVFHSAPDYIAHGAPPNVPLRLYFWREGDTWYLQDLTQPTRSKSLGVLEHRAGTEGQPPHALFRQLDDADRFPKGFIQYQLPDKGRADTVETHADWHWYDVAQWISMALAVVAIGAGLVVSGGTAAPVLVPALWTLSSAAGIVGTVGHMVHEHGQGRLTGDVILMDSAQIIGNLAGGVVSGAKAIQTARLVGLTSVAGTAATTARAARLMPLGVGALRTLLVTQTGADAVQVVFMGADLLARLREIDTSAMTDGDKLRAKIFAIGQFSLMAGLSYVSIKGNRDEINRALAAGGELILVGRQAIIPGQYSDARYTEELRLLLNRSEVLKGLPEPPVRRVPAKELESGLGLAHIEIVDGRPHIVVVDGAPPSVLAQEIDHLEQFALVNRSGDWLTPAERRVRQAAATYLTAGRDWASMSDAQRLKAHRARLTLEEDGQLRRLRRLRADVDANRPVDPLEADNAFEDLANLRQISARLAGIEERVKAGAKLADLDPDLGNQPRLYMKKTVPSEPVTEAWRTLDDKQFLLAYKSRYPDTSLTDDELLQRWALSRRLNPQTGRFIDVNTEVPDVTARYTGPTETVRTRGPHSELTSDDRTALDSLLAQRDAARTRRETAKGKVPPDVDARDRAQYEMNVASRLIGERSAEVWARRRYPGPPPAQLRYGGAGSRPGDFDQIWECTETVAGQKRTVWLVVEAKGGSSGLGSRRVASGQRAEQGTKLYFTDILNSMMAMGGDAQTYAMRIRTSGEPVRYMHVEAPMSYTVEGGVIKSQLDDLRIREFDLSPGTTGTSGSSSTSGP
jgi:hypothetical protein